MKTILVPVDFSETSFNALFYACKLAELVGANITALHVVSIPMPSEMGIVGMSYNMNQDEAHSLLDLFVAKLPEEKGMPLPAVDIARRVQGGVPAVTIAEVSKEIEADLIVMGTIEKSFVFQRMVGSVTSATINNSHCPVLLIHKNTLFRKPRKIVFAIEEKGHITSAIEKFRKFNEDLKSFTEFVHLQDTKKYEIDHVQKEIIHSLIEENPVDYSFEVKTVDGPNVEEDLVDYCLFSKADLLVMVHHEVNIFRRIFGRSTSFTIPEKLHLPILIIPGSHTDMSV